MNFNTALFLFIFLPFFLIIYFVAQPKWRSWLGLAAGLVFYAWGQAFYIPLIAGVAGVNYWFGLRLGGELSENKGQNTKRLLYTGILVNLGILVFFKVFVTYGVGWIGSLTEFLPARVEEWLQGLVFPLGLSYISFQVISYLIDVANGAVKPEKSLLNYLVYIFLFPKLLVGPITRYRSLADQLSSPSPAPDLVADGIRRFAQGLAKKVLIADVLAKVVVAVFDQPSPLAPPEIAWLALAAYALQIYFDFSGYTDMAIGLGMMMGFRFTENFNYPYISQGIGDFWRRWHISLSTWFRDYVFFPLERRRIKWIGQPANILVVFLLTGLWHGLTAQYVIWGLLHGFFMVVEALFLARWLQKVYRPIRHLYALGAILLTWLFFRSPSPAFAFAFIGRLMGDMDGVAPLVFTQSAPLPIIEPSFWMAFSFAVLYAMPVKPWVEKLLQELTAKRPQAALPLTAINDLILILLFVLSVGVMTSSKFLPGIYGRF